jgi:LPXTG-motif cell wall-anchored protein
MGIAQQDPAQPKQLELDQAASPAMSQEFVGTIAEVRDDTFSVKRDSDQAVVWFNITPALKASYAAELVTGNHVRVSAMPGDTPERWNASIVTAEASDAAQADLDTDIDADIDVDEDSVTATIDRDTTIEDNDAELREDDATYDDAADDELPRTASSLPAIGAVGLLALLGAAAVAFVRRF